MLFPLQTLRRLAQNREAARKSRLRKKVGQINPLTALDHQEETSGGKIFSIFTSKHAGNFCFSRFKDFVWVEFWISFIGCRLSLSRSLSLLQAYVQQLESSRIKLTQLEHDLQRARSQVLALFFPAARQNFFFPYCIFRTNFCFR